MPLTEAERTWRIYAYTAFDLNMIYRGSTGTVVTLGRLAFKFGRGKNGMRCNRHEVDLYLRSSAQRRSMLCPVPLVLSPRIRFDNAACDNSGYERRAR